MEQETFTKIANLDNNISFFCWDLVNGKAPESRENLAGKNWQENPEQLHTNFIFVGLNPSGNVERLTNLHNPRSQNDVKLRFAVCGTQFWGSLFVDIERKKIEADSNKVELTKKSYERFRDVLTKIIPENQRKIQIIALGKKVFDFLQKYKQNLLQGTSINTFLTEIPFVVV